MQPRNRFALFYHSVISDWNHGNAHFRRGYVRELQRLNHKVTVYEPEDAWSLANLVRSHGVRAVQQFHQKFPDIRVVRYRPEMLDLSAILDGCDIAIVHEWTDPALVKRIGQFRSRSRTLRAYFHDTHHRAISAPHEMRQYDLSHYDGVLVFGEVLRQIYLDQGWANNVLTWHEAADDTLFRPIVARQTRDLAWVGNWGDDERSAEIMDYLVTPVADLELSCSVFGVRYPAQAQRSLRVAKIAYRGWIPNYQVPQTFATFRFTLHIPRRFYVEQLPGIPTIRMFEALACGIPLISTKWQDTERLFAGDRDYLTARSPEEMRDHMRMLAADPKLRRRLAVQGLKRIQSRHTCRHRVAELMAWIRDRFADREVV